MLNRTLKIRLGQELREELRARAEREQRSESAIIRRALERELSRYRKPVTS